MIRLIFHTLGYFVALLPARCVSFLCEFFGRFFFLFFRKRRRIILSNIAHAFPHKTQVECKKMAQMSCTRMIELGLLAIALPYFSEKRIRKSFKIDGSIGEFFRDKKQNNGPRIILLPHFSQMEALTVVPLLCEAAGENEIGAIYRPFKNKALESWVLKTRERFGIKLLARGNGFFEAKKILKRNGIVVVLFDQNAGEWGVLSTFFGRITSATYLPDFLYKHFHCPIYMLMPERLGVFQAKIFTERLNVSNYENELSQINRNEELPDEKFYETGKRKKYPIKEEINLDDKRESDSYCVTKAMNAWLEQKLSLNEDICCDWLWSHNRWHICDQKHNWLNLSQKRYAIDFSKIERKVKIFIRMPNWLGDIIMMLPALKAIREARPDAHITLIVRQHFIQFLENLRVADYILPIGRRTPGRIFYPLKYYKQLLKYRLLKPDFLIRIGNDSTTSDIEVLLLNSICSFAPSFLNKKPPYFSERITMDCDSPKVHQVENLHFFLKRMGYEGNLNLDPIDLSIEKLNHIGLICGSENDPIKRWPSQHWIDFIKILLQKTTADIVLFGTRGDKEEVTRIIKNEFPNENRVIDRAGQTTLLEFMNEMAACKLVIGNDTGGVHLSNFLGIPTVVLFGPTNADKTRPIFKAPVYIIKSPKPESLMALTPDLVVETFSQFDLWSLI